MIWSWGGYALAALKGQLLLKIEMQFPVGNSCTWAFVAERTQKCTDIGLIFLPRIDCPISFASRFIEYRSPEMLFLQTRKNVSSTSPLSVLLSVSCFGEYVVPMDQHHASDVCICQSVPWTQTIPMMANGVTNAE